MFQVCVTKSQVFPSVAQVFNCFGNYGELGLARSKENLKNLENLERFFAFQVSGFLIFCRAQLAIVAKTIKNLENLGNLNFRQGNLDFYYTDLENPENYCLSRCS